LHEQHRRELLPRGDFFEILRNLGVILGKQWQSGGTEKVLCGVMLKTLCLVERLAQLGGRTRADEE
jgi:hypothetical protein